MPDLVDFAAKLRELRDARGLSVRQLADRAYISKSYIGMLERGTRPPTSQIAQRLDDTLEAHGQLVGMVDSAKPAPPAVADLNGKSAVDLAEPMGANDIEHLHETVRHLVALDTAHGSAGLHITALAAFNANRDRLARVGARNPDHADVHAAVAEVGEVAAWLAYDSDQQEDSRRAATEALLIAQRAGDTSMARFLSSHLSMQATYLGQGAEGLAIADQVIAEQPRSKRVVGLMRVRRARALARLGDGQRALAEFNLARRELSGGIGPDDPGWTWWLHTAELAVHESRIRSLAGDGPGAVAWSEQAVQALPARQGRDQVLYRAWLISDLVDVHGWREVDDVVGQLLDTAAAGSSARVPRILRAASRRASRASAPSWLVDSLHDAVEASSQAT
ncbi:hypothetical protein Aph02nite_17400 [Actinoplanes philippinensis]|uniref:Helix-turn-helix domain-containing protein n=1 Tax=Actinoplanes philippinensis TaxID=35752 RepID=A0A1I2BCP4_9ACTN|nr:helix-turn-helix transcriptional regulator [Actinoplanes philippinensis]GIE75790.1 hypothetical protein Aph02nite_17400 [Actinoplanes philippinensis]SFE53063.1 Helix-turn-helix domain-containing protein [Actinoplanes philippinensis]